MDSVAAVRRINRRALVSFIAVLAGLVVAMAAIIVVLQRAEWHREAREGLQREIILLGELATDAVLTSDYAAVEGLVRRWVERRGADVGVTIVMPNGFVLATAGRTDAGTAPIRVTHDVVFDGRVRMTLHGVLGISRLNERLAAAVLPVAAGSVVAVLILGGVLWWTLQRTAFGPLAAQTADLQVVNRDLRVAEGKYARLFESTGDGIYGIDHEGRGTFINPAAAIEFGLAPEEVVGRNMHALVHHSRADGTGYAVEECPILRTYREGTGCRVVDEVFWRKDGTCFPVEYSSFPLVGEEGPNGAVVVFRNIAERKAAEAAARRAQQRFDLLFSNSMDGVLLTAPDGSILAANPAACRILGRDEEEIRRLGRTSLVDLSDPRLAQALEERARTGRVAAEVTMIRKDGSKFPAEISSVVFADDDGNARTSMTMRDISERKRTEAALVEAKAAAEQANRAKSEFLSRMSHELRTPLNSILGFAQLLDFELETPEQRDGVRHILRGGRHLLALIDEVLDIARIEAGHLSISPEPVSLGDVLRVAVDLVRPQAAARGVVLPQVDAGDVHVLTDRQRLQQVFLNLLSNAIKYNRESGWVRIAWEPHGADRLRIRLADSGLGIAPEMMRRLFTPFDRLGAEQTGIEGTGLGLALSKRLVEAMGGTLSAESTVGEGTTFTIELQVARPVDSLVSEPLTADDSVARPSPVRGTILSIEDNLANVALLERLVRRRPGLELLSAMQGGRGLELARDHRPDLVLLDLHLPDMPGTEVLARLRADARTRTIPVVILSADATERQIARLEAQGVRAYLTKPLDVMAMLRLLDEVFGDRA